ncbi:endo alpha-1,4 polygalactosaminidase [Rubellimicrobium roseum]|uniref:Glycoside-hydrolase family GH114 TIM-barrel domain-containing protein n=1 Tax=Rubellimicrobium roseum TaxID=687525 RepID=A0A5C4NJK8_9RHOB|nr:endo alpha-1,4 polygalactosaminidase [Rubellimicrobium roseum]TNC74974.1 hypothetical protein FHG71_02295 [Rubellimicrobium roseum]
MDRHADTAYGRLRTCHIACESEPIAMRALTWICLFCASTTALADDAVVPASGVVPAPAGDAATGSPPHPTERACRASADRSRALRLRRALEAGFGVQYWGERYTAQGLADQPHGLLIMEGTKVGAPYSDTGREVFFTPEEIAMITHDGERPALGYLNVGEIEDHRDYWVEMSTRRDQAEAFVPPEWLGPRTAHGDHLSAYWTPAWRHVMLARVDRLMALGVDGLFLDDVLHYYTHATDKGLSWPEPGRPEGPQDAPGLALAMMELVLAIAERVRTWDCNALVIVNNGVFIGRDAGEPPGHDGSRPAFAAYLDAIDGLLVENALSSADHPDTRAALKEDFLDSGLPILTVDAVALTGGHDTAAQQQRVAEEARRSGFVPYVVEDTGFNRLWAPTTRP